MRSKQLDTIGLRTVSGFVNADGSIASGSGFIVRKTGTGTYVINLSPPMRVIRSWIATGATGFATVNPGASASSASVATSVAAGSGADSIFSFTATGY
jgi:hypothetical protein